MIRTIMIEQIGHAGFYDSYFVNDIIPMLKERELLPDGVGRLIGYGNEAVIFSFGTDKVIRLHPTYEKFPEQVDEILHRMKDAPSGGLYATVYDVDIIEALDEESGDIVTFAVYAIMERLTGLNQEEAATIDDVVTKNLRLSDIPGGALQDFLKKYTKLPIDHDSKNVMKRGDDYFIVDPE